MKAVQHLEASAWCIVQGTSSLRAIDTISCDVRGPVILKTQSAYNRHIVHAALSNQEV
jgi:hypothetical protein